jgi:hypothetical protein
MQVTDGLHIITQSLLADDMTVPQIRTRSCPSAKTVCQKKNRIKRLMEKW